MSLDLREPPYRAPGIAYDAFRHIFDTQSPFFYSFLLILRFMIGCLRVASDKLAEMKLV